MDFVRSYFGKNEPLTSWTLLSPVFFQISTDLEKKRGTKEFNWSEVHFYRSTSYKIHTLRGGRGSKIVKCTYLVPSILILWLPLSISISFHVLSKNTIWSFQRFGLQGVPCSNPPPKKYFFYRNKCQIWYLHINFTQIWSPILQLWTFQSPQCVW